MCSDAAGKETPYGTLLAMRQKLNCPSQWDKRPAAPFFTCRQGDNYTQVWYDDPRSLAFNYRAAQRLGLRGVGLWAANHLDYDDEDQVADMWGALP